ncbi:MAG: YesL family protein [Bifidobacteriaceae bacterium]|jgi:uncharacterized membrane protein YesL|nr:YesL family protein [Bifidobacteriaceae bacterium]
MSSLFRQDSAFMRALGWLVEVVEINLLMLVTSIPIVTIGASLTAGYDAARRLRIGEGKTLPNYLRAFKANFVKSTILWLILGPIGAAIVAFWIFIQMTPLLVVKFALSIIWLIVFYWAWPLTARFENTVGATLKNALVIGISKIIPSVGMFAVDATFCALVATSWLYMPQGLFLLAIFGAGLLTALHVPIAESGLKQFIPEEPKQEQEPEQPQPQRQPQK